MSDGVNDSLNKVLADYHVFYQNLRNFHWNVKGRSFFVLHSKFEDLYTSAAEDIDKIAEQILIRGGQPLFTLQDYLRISDLKEEASILNADGMIQRMTSDLEVLVANLSKASAEADDVDDAATEDLLDLLIAGHKKTLWMLRAYLSE